MLTLQNLPPKYARLCLQLVKVSGKLGIENGMKLLLAVSGGADSTALVTIYKILAPRLAISMEALHVDHGLRPTSSEEAELTRTFCQNLGIPCHIVKVEVAQQASLRKCGLEEAGREVRYNILEAHRVALHANFILTGHQAEDLGEDIIMRLMRGAAWPGLSGMGWRNGHVLHPLLHHSSLELKNFLKACNIPWIEDPSNQSLTFRRNRVRHLLMPLLRCENPAITLGLQRLHDLGTLDKEYFEQELANHLIAYPWQETNENLILPKGLLASMHPALRLRLYNKALRHIRDTRHLKGQNETSTLVAIDAMYCANIGAKTVQCSGGITATLLHRSIILNYNRNG